MKKAVIRGSFRAWLAASGAGRASSRSLPAVVLPGGTISTEQSSVRTSTRSGGERRAWAAGRARPAAPWPRISLRARRRPGGLEPLAAETAVGCRRRLHRRGTRQRPSGPALSDQLSAQGRRAGSRIIGCSETTKLNSSRIPGTADRHLLSERAPLAAKSSSCQAAHWRGALEQRIRALPARFADRGVSSGPGCSRTPVTSMPRIDRPSVWVTSPASPRPGRARAKRYGRSSTRSSIVSYHNWWRHRRLRRGMWLASRRSVSMVSSSATTPTRSATRT